MNSAAPTKKRSDPLSDILWDLQCLREDIKPLLVGVSPFVALDEMAESFINNIQRVQKLLKEGI